MKLKRERTRYKLSQNALARESGVSQPMISRIESGEVKDPAFSILDLLARALRRRGSKVQAGDLQPQQALLVKGMRITKKGRKRAEAAA
jgi:transcriptional regulator with XRE-family HTH domain